MKPSPIAMCAVGKMKGVKMDQDSISWGELAELTHGTQVERFGFCTCEDNEGNENPYTDCPKGE